MKTIKGFINYSHSPPPPSLSFASVTFINLIFNLNCFDVKSRNNNDDDANNNKKRTLETTERKDIQDGAGGGGAPSAKRLLLPLGSRSKHSEKQLINTDCVHIAELEKCDKRQIEIISLLKMTPSLATPHLLESLS